MFKSLHKLNCIRPQEDCSNSAEPCDFKGLDIACMCSNTDFQAQVRDCINRDCPDQLAGKMVFTGIFPRTS